MGRRYLPQRTWTPYLEAGLSVGYSLVFDEEATVRRSFGVQERTGYLPADFQRFEYGALVGTGIQYDSFVAGTRFSVHLGFSNIPSWKYELYTPRGTLFLGYRF